MISDIARKIGYTSSICSVPVPDRRNNMYSTSLAKLQTTMPWYKGWRKDLTSGEPIFGTNVVEAIDSTGLSFPTLQQTPFRAIVSWTSLVPSTATIRVLAGSAKVGDTLKVFPGNLITTTISHIRQVGFDLNGEVLEDWPESTGGPGNLVELTIL
jgi:hypothetical protein